jgi:hypothetical protein
MVQRFVDGAAQDEFGVYENVYLVSADTEEEARRLQKCRELGLLRAVVEQAESTVHAQIDLMGAELAAIDVVIDQPELVPLAANAA